MQYASFHWIFLINLSVALVGCVATLRFMPDGRAHALSGLDLTGYCSLAFGMATLSLSLSLGGLSELWLRHAEGPGRRHGQQRQQPAVDDGADAGDGPGCGRSGWPVSGAPSATPSAPHALPAFRATFLTMGADDDGCLDRVLAAGARCPGCAGEDPAGGRPTRSATEKVRAALLHIPVERLRPSR
ncbi:hypothetical protein [Xylophilus ampelinus]|uniref:hypothetical protein n=1 Tax=Xylophilus ampelinus TaxID=54067 RepID=UPI0011B4775E|nr:hypothetical protein [Xylophilus ampelinus]MCS4510472.1 hypothetical protein [Xylophilus ampelinus]